MLPHSLLLKKEKPYLLKLYLYYSAPSRFPSLSLASSPSTPTPSLFQALTERLTAFPPHPCLTLRLPGTLESSILPSVFRLACVREGPVAMGLGVWRKDHSRKLGFARLETQRLCNRNSDVLILIFFNPHLLEAQLLPGKRKDPGVSPCSPN